jgi:signal transduction histidine kinase
MTTCFDGVTTDPIFLAVTFVSSVAAFIVIWVKRHHSFYGKTFYMLTFIAMMWTMMMVGLEAASQTFSCQLQWATFAWLGNGLVPVAWCFFVFAYVDNPDWLKKRFVKSALVVFPLTIFGLAATNPWHNLMYTEATIIPPGSDRTSFSHGPVFYGTIATLYAFVIAALFCLLRAFARSKREAWPLLTMLIVVTTIPLTANLAYTVLGITVAGLDPTAFMFAFGILAFTWLLTTNKTMDMAAVGKSVLFDAMSEPVVLIDRQRKIVLQNTAAKRKALLDDASLVTHVLADFDRLEASQSFGHMVVGQRAYEPRIQKIENPLKPAQDILGWSVTFVDVTDRLSIHSKLEKALQRADEANRAKDDFISVVSHELRTPLTSLKGGLALALSGRLGELADPVRSSLEIAHRNGVRLSRLIDNILLAQKIDIDALALEETSIRLGSLLEESLEENKAFAAERSLTLVATNVHSAAVVIGDAFAMRQIVDNLVSNAIKFSKANGEIAGSVTVVDGRVRLSIKDSGPGIPEGMERVVFGRFEQLKGSGQGATQGSGLGLHISQKLARQMCGDLFYESEVGVGTIFHLEFRLADSQTLEQGQVVG